MIESLIVLLILVLLVAMILPALAAARKGAERLSGMGHMRGLFQAVQLYSNDYDLHYPYLGTPGDPSAPLQFGQTRIQPGPEGELYFRYLSTYWVSRMRPYLSGFSSMVEEGVFHDLSDTATSEPIPSDTVYSSSILMTQTALADPLFFTNDGPHVPGYMRGVRATEVLHPPRKGLLLGFAERSSPDQPQFDAALVAFCDGSISKEAWVTRSFQPEPPPPYDLQSYFPIMTTLDGVKGIDY